MVLAFHASRQSAFPGAYVGVEIYFVLSGFLITALLIDEFATNGRISFPKFYARRALRLFPAIVPFLLACLAIYVRVHDELRAQMARYLFATVFYCANIFEAYGHPLYWAHTWSLSAEEQFYLLWPALLVVLLWSRLPPRAVAGVTFAVLVAAALARVVAWNIGAHQGDSRFGFYSPFTHADGLLIGCLLGELYAWNLLPVAGRLRAAIRLSGLPALGVVIAVLFAVPSDSRFLYEGGFTLATVACALVVLGALEEEPQPPFRLLGWRPLRYVGEISYALYIWNPLFLFNYPGSAINPVLGTALTFAAAAASFHWIEIPALRLKRRFAPVPHQADVVVEPAPLPPERRETLVPPKPVPK